MTSFQIDVLEIAHKGWGWTSVIAGMGFLQHRFANPYLFTGSWNVS